MTYEPEWFYPVSMIPTSWFSKVSRRRPEATTAVELVMGFLHTIMRSKVSLFSSTLSVSTIFSQGLRSSLDIPRNIWREEVFLIASLQTSAIFSLLGYQKKWSPLKWGLKVKLSLFSPKCEKQWNSRKRDQYFNTVPRLLPEIYISTNSKLAREKRAFFEAFLTYPRVSRYIICFSLRRLSSLEFGHSYMKSEIVEIFFGE